MAVNHGTVPRGLMGTPQSQSHEGRFGRLFRNLPAFAPDDADLVALAKTVIEQPFDVEEADEASNIHDPTRVCRPASPT